MGKQQPAAKSSRYKIEHNAPIPPGVMDPRGRSSKYPFREMAIGDRFFVPATAALFSLEPVASAMHQARRRFKRDFRWYRGSRNGVDGYYIWRAA